MLCPRETVGRGPGSGAVMLDEAPLENGRKKRKHPIHGWLPGAFRGIQERVGRKSETGHQTTRWKQLGDEEDVGAMENAKKQCSQAGKAWLDKAKKAVADLVSPSKRTGGAVLNDEVVCSAPAAAMPTTDFSAEVKTDVGRKDILAKRQ